MPGLQSSQRIDDGDTVVGNPNEILGDPAGTTGGMLVLEISLKPPNRCCSIAPGMDAHGYQSWTQLPWRPAFLGSSSSLSTFRKLDTESCKK
jgi:hypothetical protein